MYARKTKETKSQKAAEELAKTKILEAANTLFNQKGFAHTRMRDIGKKSGINHSLIFYHFQNKNNLYETILLQATTEFIQTMLAVFNDKKTTLEKKIELCASRYIDVLIKNPNMASFVVERIYCRPKLFKQQRQYEDLIKNSLIIKQIEKAIANGEIKTKSPRIFLVNILGLIIFPFLSAPVCNEVLNINRTAFNKLMVARKKMIPVWIKKMFFTF